MESKAKFQKYLCFIVEPRIILQTVKQEYLRIYILHIKFTISQEILKYTYKTTQKPLVFDCPHFLH